MGLAASQARFLSLTARVSNTEYQGQQINQQRNVLADETSNLFNRMMSVATPTPPDPSKYSASTQYTYNDDNGSTKTITGYSSITSGANSGKYTITYADGTTAIADSITIASGVLSTVTFNGSSTPTSLNAITITAADAYDAAYAQYQVQENQYNQQITRLNAETSAIQQKDKTLEMQLRQLDTAEKEYQTELESIKKVIDKNIDIVFKTFA
ncbi:MAG: hypothetical protein WC197_04305 [Candidatus Gastranaerophilaceae bacterium]|jgi:hypothetical protein